MTDTKKTKDSSNQQEPQKTGKASCRRTYSNGGGYGKPNK